MGVSHLISIVGAGPGDPELLTIKANRRLQEAEVVLYDALMGSEVLGLANSDATKVYVGKLYKDGQNQKERQNEIHKQFLHWARQKKRIVRLKAGDPMIFGRGAEEIRFCKTNGLNYEVIPGITAGIAGASLLDIPLTERGKNATVLFYTGHRIDGGFTDMESIITVLKSGSPVVVYMGVNNLPNLSSALLLNKIDDKMPVQILSRISQKEQKIYHTYLGKTSELVEKNNLATPAIIIIGKHAEKISGNETSPSADGRVPRVV